MNYKRPESVLVVVYTPNGQVLLLRRRQPPDFWQSVTGSLEWGECPSDAAHREVVEETGLSSDGLEDCNESHIFEIYPIFQRRYAPGVTENLEHVFRLCVPHRCDITLDTLEHDTYQWLEKRVAASHVRSYTNRDAILKCVPGPHQVAK